MAAVGFETPADVARIVDLADPELRNYQITYSYHRLSSGFARWSPGGANWCTFATWASKQAGCTIRYEDLMRAVWRGFAGSQDVLGAAAAAASSIGLRQEAILDAVDEALRELQPLTRASAAVARGNVKVYAEIGLLFSRLLERFPAPPEPDDEKLAAFLTLRPGPPPDGQNLLREAFGHYVAASRMPPSKQRAETMMLANVQIGLHEQTRLQPEIRESLDAASVDARALAERLRDRLAQRLSLTSRLLRRLAPFWKTPLETLSAVVASHAANVIRRTLTDCLMTIELPGPEILRLGRDIRLRPADELRVIESPEVKAFLTKVDPTPNSSLESGAEDWANLEDRVHYIADFFRAYQTARRVTEAPFQEETIRAIEHGRRPASPAG